MVVAPYVPGVLPPGSARTGGRPAGDPKASLLASGLVQTLVCQTLQLRGTSFAVGIQGPVILTVPQQLCKDPLFILQKRSPCLPLPAGEVLGPLQRDITCTCSTQK